MSSRSAQPFVSIPPAEHAVSSFYISYRGFDAATRPPGGLRRPGSPSQALWVGEDRTCPPCPLSGRSAPRTLAHRAPWGARKRRRPGSANDTRLAPPACSTAPERPRMDMGPAQRQPYGPGGHVPRRHRILQQEVRWRPPKWDSRVPATLVPDGAAPRTQESHPSTLGGLGALNERFDSRVPLDATPLGGHRLTSGPSTATTRAPSVSGVTGWVLVARRASPNVGARTCSICARVALRRVVPCAAPEALGGLGSLGTCPVCTPSGCGRSARRVATAHAHEDPAPRAGCTRVGRVFLPRANSWLILPPHHHYLSIYLSIYHNLRHLRAAPRRGLARGAAGPPGP